MILSYIRYSCVKNRGNSDDPTLVKLLSDNAVSMEVTSSAKCGGNESLDVSKLHQVWTKVECSMLFERKGALFKDWLHSIPIIGNVLLSATSRCIQFN